MNGRRAGLYHIYTIHHFAWARHRLSRLPVTFSVGLGSIMAAAFTDDGMKYGCPFIKREETELGIL